MFGVASSVFQNLPTLVLERIRPQASRISPIKGWSRLFSLPGLVEFGKSLFKVVVVGVILFFVLRSEYFGSIDAMFSDPQTILVRIMAAMRKIIIVMAGDVPARVEAHLAFGIGENLDALGIEAVEPRIRQHVPMRGLQIVKALDLALALEIARGVGE